MLQLAPLEKPLLRGKQQNTSARLEESTECVALSRHTLQAIARKFHSALEGVAPIDSLFELDFECQFLPQKNVSRWCEEPKY